MTNKPMIGFIGLGTMGYGMAGNLARAGFDLKVFSRKGRRLELDLPNIAYVASSKVAADADVIISMVADDAASQAVWSGEDGALAGLRPGSVCIESSTLSLDWTGALANLARARGCAFLDAPVTGSKPQAENGELKFLVGGEGAILDQVMPVLSVMGTAAELIGPVGSGTFLKLVNNFICGVQVASLAEGLAMIARQGLDYERASSILIGGACGSPLVKLIAGRIAAKDFAPNFSVSLLQKDLAYAIAGAEKLGLDLRTAAAALEWFSEANEAGLGQQDIAAVSELIRDK
jgi:3-hydroxyisobutyrate dehydrogenase